MRIRTFRCRIFLWYPRTFKHRDSLDHTTPCKLDLADNTTLSSHIIDHNRNDLLQMHDQRILKRCRWTAHDPLLIDYHDHEWGQINTNEQTLWEYFILEMFQSGLSWRTILYKRNHFRQAFLSFNPQKMASFGQKEYSTLIDNPLIIRSKRKIKAAIENARIYLNLIQHDRSLTSVTLKRLQSDHLLPPLRDDAPSSPLSIALTKDFKDIGFIHIGQITIQAWLQAIGVLHGHEPNCYLYNKELPANPSR